MRRVGKQLVLEGHGEVTEVLPFVFLKDGHLTYDRFAFVSSYWSAPCTSQIWKKAGLSGPPGMFEI